jgi:hypothetical protein
MGIGLKTPPSNQHGHKKPEKKLYITKSNYIDLNNKRNYVPIQPVFINNNVTNETKKVRRFKGLTENKTKYYAKINNLNRAKKEFINNTLSQIIKKNEITNYEYKLLNNTKKNLYSNYGKSSAFIYTNTNNANTNNANSGNFQNNVPIYVRKNLLEKLKKENSNKQEKLNLETKQRNELKKAINNIVRKVMITQNNYDTLGSKVRQNKFEELKQKLQSGRLISFTPKIYFKETISNDDWNKLSGIHQSLYKRETDQTNLFRDKYKFKKQV